MWSRIQSCSHLKGELNWHILKHRVVPSAGATLSRPSEWIGLTQVRQFQRVCSEELKLDTAQHATTHQSTHASEFHSAAAQLSRKYKNTHASLNRGYNCMYD